MNLDELLDVTEPVTVQFMEHEITAHVYTAGWNRMTKEDRDTWNSVSSNGNGDAKDGVLLARTVLPMLLKGWDLDGTPLLYKEKGFPENVPLCPDALLVAVADPVLTKWQANNPTSGEPVDAGSPPEEKQELSQIESSTP